MNIFLDHLSKQYPREHILLVLDNASWHKAKGLLIPHNIELYPLLPYTLELNPIEQIWHAVREKGFRNELFGTLDAVIRCLCETLPQSFSAQGRLFNLLLIGVGLISLF